MIGRTLARTYQIERLLGGGGMGAVYAARHVRTGGIFAVKVLHRETAADAEIYKRFQDEARTVSALRHPHIVQVTDFDQDEDGNPFIVMELLEGEDLYQRLCRVGKLPIEQVLDIGRQVGSALHAAHEKGVIHRDIKPQNIFLVRHELADMVSEVAKVVDFGISKIRRTGGQMTRDMTILGTPQFMSPEAALGQNSQLDGRADQWSLAVIMYLALSGRLPFDGENLVGVLYMVVHEQPVPLPQLAPDVPEHVVAAINRAMSKKKDERFPRMADFVRAIMGQAGGNMRITSGLQMNSALFRLALPLEQPAHSPADAPTAVPHMGGTPPGGRAGSLPPMGQRGPGQAPPPAGPRRPEAATVVPLPVPGPESIPTRPNMSADMLPMTVPAVQPPPELVATPSSPTAMAPFLAEATRVNVMAPLPPPKRSGETPTNISMDQEALKSLLEGDEESAATPKDAHGQDDGDPTPDPGDIQGVPTRVASMPFYDSSGQPPPQAPPPPLPPAGELGSLQATVPLTSMRILEQGSAVDSAYPSTLTRAAGQQAESAPPKGLAGYIKSINWTRQRERLLSLAGIVPRSPQRLAIAAGGAAVLFVLLIILIVSGSRDKQPDKTPQEATPQQQEDDRVEPTHPVATPDGGSTAAPSGDNTEPPDANGETGPNGTKTPGKKVKPSGLTKRPGGKPGSHKPKLF